MIVTAATNAPALGYPPIQKLIPPLNPADGMDVESAGEGENIGMNETNNQTQSQDMLSAEVISDLRSLDDREFISDLLETFLRDAQARLHAMSEALDSSDLEQFGRLAHTMKGSSGSIGAQKLFLLAREAMDTARDHDLAKSRELTRQIAEVLEPNTQAVRRALID
ncbi:MAG: Hpt domain-containing protein [Phycisphaeraceae bacterium]|nr:Hpt domain-containing protein [Phycisphaeraceae bacterium]